MRKELSVFVKTSNEDEIVLSSTNVGVVVLNLPNGFKVGVDPKELSDALFEIQFFKKYNTKEDSSVFEQQNVVNLGEV